MDRLDRKHLRWIVESCDWYLARQSGLARTISDIEVLIGEINRGDNKPLIARLQGHWGVLEDLYAVDLNEPHRRVLLEFQDQLDQAAQNIRALAIDALTRAGHGLQPAEDEDDEENG